MTLGQAVEHLKTEVQKQLDAAVAVICIAQLANTTAVRRAAIPNNRQKDLTSWVFVWLEISTRC